MRTEKCKVCEKTHDLVFEPRFGYHVCRKHENVPPAHMGDAQVQYEAVGITDWDKR